MSFALIKSRINNCGMCKLVHMIANELDFDTTQNLVELLKDQVSYYSRSDREQASNFARDMALQTSLRYPLMTEICKLLLTN